MILLSQEGQLGLPVSDKNDHFFKSAAQGLVMMMMVMGDLLFLISLETMSHGDGSGSASCLPPFLTWPGISTSWSWWCCCDGNQIKILSRTWLVLACRWGAHLQVDEWVGQAGQGLYTGNMQTQHCFHPSYKLRKPSHVLQGQDKTGCLSIIQVMSSSLQCECLHS